MIYGWIYDLDIVDSGIKVALHFPFFALLMRCVLIQGEHLFNSIQGIELIFDKFILNV